MSARSALWPPKPDRSASRYVAQGVPEAAKVLDHAGGASDFDRFIHTIDVNPAGTYNAVRLCTETMVDNEPVGGDRGVIVCTSSVAAFDASVGQAAGHPSGGSGA